VTLKEHSGKRPRLLLRITRISWRDLIATIIPVGLISIIAIAVAWRFVQPAPPSTITAAITSHCTAPTAASAGVEMRPMNHMSVRLSTICTALLAISGNASANTAR